MHEKTQSGASGPNLSYAGPGARITKGFKQMGHVVPGLNSAGSNSMANLIDKVPNKVKDVRAAELRKGQYAQNARTVILIKGHSRGSVAASQIAEILAHDLKNDNVKIEVTLFDPVPGPKAEGKNSEIDFSGLKNTITALTVVYSVKAKGYQGFTPQQVLGADRIIISKQDHSAGLREGFSWRGKLYRGSRLNSLPPGVYVDRNNTHGIDVELERVDNMASVIGKVGRAKVDAATDEAHNQFDALLRSRKTKKTDDEREARVKAVLTEYYERTMQLQRTDHGPAANQAQGQGQGPQPHQRGITIGARQGQGPQQQPHQRGITIGGQRGR